MITNQVYGKRYIGSSVHLHTRLQEHRWSLRNNRHRNKHLQNAWNTYGEGCFTFEPLLYCDRDMTLYYEQVLLDGLKPEYNFAKDAKAPMLGVRFSDEHKSKIGEANKGERSYRYGTHLSEDEKRHLSEVFKDRQFSEETRAKLREARKLREPVSDETRAKMRESQKGKHSHSEEWCQSMSKAMKGNLNPFFGRHHTEETKRKISESKRRRNNGSEA